VDQFANVTASEGTIRAALGKLTLPDLGYDVLPKIDSIWSDYVLYGLLLATAVRFGAVQKVMRSTIWRRWMTMLGILFFLRGISIVVTPLPNPDHTCKSTLPRDEFILLSALKVMLYVAGTCDDVLYSGHTTNLTLFALMWHRYSHVHPVVEYNGYGCDEAGSLCPEGPATEEDSGDLLRCTPAKLIVWAYTVCSYCVIIASHFHYTIDVFIATVLTLLVWKLYHNYIKTCHIRDNCFNRSLHWMERGAEDLQGRFSEQHDEDSSDIEL